MGRKGKEPRCISNNGGGERENTSFEKKTSGPSSAKWLGRNERKEPTTGAKEAEKTLSRLFRTER